MSNVNVSNFKKIALRKVALSLLSVKPRDACTQGQKNYRQSVCAAVESDQLVADGASL
jgi:hypothetical protein